MSLYERMKSEVVPALKDELKRKNKLAVPRIDKVLVNVGIGTLTKQTKDFSEVITNVEKITGQKPVVTKAKIAVSNFKLRKGMPVGITNTLRGKRAYDLVDRLVLKVGSLLQFAYQVSARASVDIDISVDGDFDDVDALERFTLECSVSGMG